MNRRSFFSRITKGLLGLAIAQPLADLVQPVNTPIAWKSYSPSAAQIAFVKSILQNAIDTHDRMIEEAIFSESL